ncbi:farnesyl diphosphate synthase [Phakopsora pachyrhizi]|uniref:(2E,6E)-farnesyl diphosphate synthase n=1 Tax=Phakopsora pachyrhizi TaxID=170000 RepID=A0AAV0AKT0_PHAPC|nr:farnesyl diphosphate synthase [Phakopsora pachyrhizi]CAH7667934.1 farnesyl diphosphate synthase [Phakopsora pachyrhizi]
MTSPNFTLVRDKFLGTWSQVKNDILESVRAENFPQDALAWFENNLVYNTPGGKLNRATSVIDTLEILKGKQLTPEEFYRAAVLGWCVELLQAFFLVADDIMDQSVTRRGQPCWYRAPKVGNIAINDSFMLESSIYVLLKKYFRQDKIYVNLLELFHDTTYQTEMGQLIDLLTAPEDLVDLEKFSLEKHHLIVTYKTAFYSFYLPVALAMRLQGIKSPLDPDAPEIQSSETDLFLKAKEILLPIGEYFQVQDDYLDCFGDPALIGKIGTDILDNKCSWNINVALKFCNEEQRKILDENYGKKDAASELRVKQIFNSPNVNLKRRFEEYEDQTYSTINEMIESLDESQGLKKSVFKTFLAKIHKRQK